jgi:hypothetical protein
MILPGEKDTEFIVSSSSFSTRRFSLASQTRAAATFRRVDVATRPLGVVNGSDESVKAGF